MMRKKTILRYLARCLAAALLLSACASTGDGGEEWGGAPSTRLRLLVQLPSANATDSTATRLGDPGSPTGEGEAWDVLTLLFVYQGDTLPQGATSRVVSRTLAKADFDALPRYNDSTDIRQYDIRLPHGNVYAYGLAYDRSAAESIGLPAQISACATKASVDNLAITNAYASDDDDRVAKMLSVATGYYRSPDDDSQQGIIHLEGMYGDITPGYDLPMLPLYRLAAKIDIQWDAQTAVTDKRIRVTGFSYDGGSATATDAGSGRLFPSLSTSTESLGGTTAFSNTTEISQINGRTYHYVFPDGQQARPLPSFTFSITDGTTTAQKTLRLTHPLEQAAWYKLNATVKGVGADQEMQLSFK